MSYKCKVQVMCKKKVVREFDGYMTDDRNTFKLTWNGKKKVFKHSKEFGWPVPGKSAAEMAVEYVIRNLKTFDPQTYRAVVRDRNA